MNAARNRRPLQRVADRAERAIDNAQRRTDELAAAMLYTVEDLQHIAHDLALDLSDLIRELTDGVTLEAEYTIAGRVVKMPVRVRIVPREEDDPTPPPTEPDTVTRS